MASIYGPLSSDASLVIGTGHHNSVHGLLCHEPDESLMVRPLARVSPSAVVELRWEPITKNTFVLHIYDSHSKHGYLGVRVESDGNRNYAIAALVPEPTVFSLHYSTVDARPHYRMMSGTLSSLTTRVGESDYTVHWRIEGFEPGDLILLLPTEWFDSHCVVQSGLHDLITSLKQINYRGYTQSSWCQAVPQIRNCENTGCGECLGPCTNPQQICVVNEHAVKYPFTCIVPEGEEVDDSNNAITWLAVIIVFLVVIILALGLTWTRRRS